MAKIVRYNGNLLAFASSALGTERTLFGEITQANDLTSQFTADFLRGWGIVGPSDQPTLEDFNAAIYTNGQLSAYLHQIGIAEYNAAQEYHLGSLCNVAGVVYWSRINTNVGNAPASSPTQWRELYSQATETIRGSASVATQALAEAGADDTTMMTPLKTAQAFASKNSKDGIAGSHSNLKLSATGTSAPVTITADAVCVKNAAFEQKVISPVSLSASLAASGVNGLDTGVSAVSTWYSVWVIWNGVTASSLLSLSATSPTMPAGYTHKARVGWVRSDATANKFPLSFIQIGKQVRYVVAAGSNFAASAVMASGILGSVTTPTWSAVNVDPFIPPTASIIDFGTGTLAQGFVYMVADTNSYGAFSSTTNPPPVLQNTANPGADFLRFMSRLFVGASRNIFCASNASDFNLRIIGWEDNL